MDETSLTYDELALALNRTPDATRQLVRRRRWRRTVGNDGKTRVSVPFDALEPLRAPDIPPPGTEVEAPTLPVRSPNIAPEAVAAPSDDARALIALLHDRIGELSERTAQLEDELKDLRPKAGRVDVLDALLEAERRRGDELKADLDKLMARLLAPVPGGILSKIKRALSS